jgi:hypothetical protein
LFDKYGLLREANKSQLSDALTSLPVDKRKLDTPKYHVLDGGSLIHRFPWKKGATFEEIVKTYVQYVKSFTKPTVVFDGYKSSSTIKISHTSGGQRVL